MRLEYELPPAIINSKELEIPDADGNWSENVVMAIAVWRERGRDENIRNGIDFNGDAIEAYTAIWRGSSDVIYDIIVGTSNGILYKRI